uniref:F-box domain-containing protein n=1 Tax=Panagrolaimus sp. JU765 TaxID=591449 RepID=A0AC34Q923_9BILA
MCSLTQLPTEVLVKILGYIPGEELHKCKQTSKKLNSVVRSHPFLMQKVRCRMQAHCGETLVLSVAKSGNHEFTFLSEDNLTEICRMQISELTVIGNENFSTNDAAVEDLLKVLKTTKQNSVRILNVKNLQIQNSVLAQMFLNYFSTNLVQEINLRCPISKQLTPEHVKAMDSLCQFRIADHETEFPQNTADAIVSKFIWDMRHKPRINIPFVAEVNCLAPATIVKLIEEWIFLPETPFFQLKFTNCDNQWLSQFLDLCDQSHLRHVFYEFASKANPYAHIKMKIHEESNTCTIFPITDVPARSPVNQYVCYARYFRDF